MRRLPSNRLALCLVLTSVGPCIAQTAKTDGYCSPIIQNQSGQMQVTVICGDKKTQQQIAEQNIETLYEAVNRLRATQSFYLMPALATYSQNPTDENWTAVMVEVNRTSKMLEATIEATISYLGTLKEDNVIIGDIPKLLSSRSNELRIIQEGGKTPVGNSVEGLADRGNVLQAAVRSRPMSQAEISDWSRRYSMLMAQLGDELGRLRTVLKDTEKAK